MIDELSNAKFANPNLIFTAKAAYGMRETSPIPAAETENRRVLTAAELPKLGEPKEDGEKNVTQLPHLGDESQE